MTFSVILTSIDRKAELARFVCSINEQKNFDLSKLQIIFIDQAENADIFTELDKRVNYQYVKHHKCSLSEARNRALPLVSNEIVCFGDDDAWYDNNTFFTVEKYLNEGYDGVFGIVENENNVHANVFPAQPQFLSYTKHCGAMSASMFIKHEPALKFDENIGVGSPYNLGSGEETDYLFAFMEKHPKFRFYFTPEIIVRHPVNMQNGDLSYIKKQYLYARGAGYVLRKHSKLPLCYILKQFARPLCGIVFYAIKSPYKAKKSFYLFKGRLEGFFYKVK